MYNKAPVFGTWLRDPLPPVSEPIVDALATCVAEKAKKRKRKVPQNSPIIAIKWLRNLLGSHSNPGNRRSPFGPRPFCLTNGRCRPPEGASTFMLIGECCWSSKYGFAFGVDEG